MLSTRWKVELMETIVSHEGKVIFHPFHSLESWTNGNLVDQPWYFPLPHPFHSLESWTNGNVTADVVTLRPSTDLSTRWKVELMETIWMPNLECKKPHSFHSLESWTNGNNTVFSLSPFTLVLSTRWKVELMETFPTTANKTVRHKLSTRWKVELMETGSQQELHSRLLLSTRWKVELMETSPG